MKRILVLFLGMFLLCTNIQADCIYEKSLEEAMTININNPCWDTFLFKIEDKSDFPILVNGNTYYLVVKYNRSNDNGNKILFVHPAVYNYDTESSISTEQHGCLVDDNCVLGFYNINSDREYNAEDYDDLERDEFERNEITFFFHYSMGMGDARSDAGAFRVEIWDTCPEDFDYTCDESLEP